MKHGATPWVRWLCLVALVVVVAAPGAAQETPSDPRLLMQWRVRVQPAGAAWRDHRIGWAAGSVALPDRWTCQFGEVSSRAAPALRGHLFRRDFFCTRDHSSVGLELECRVERRGQEWVRHAGSAELRLGRDDAASTRVTFACGALLSDALVPPEVPPDA